MKIYQLKLDQSLMDSTGFKCKVDQIRKGEIIARYPSGATWTYTQQDFDNGIIKTL